MQVAHFFAMLTVCSSHFQCLSEFLYLQISVSISQNFKVTLDFTTLLQEARYLHVTKNFVAGLYNCRTDDF